MINVYKGTDQLLANSKAADQSWADEQVVNAFVICISQKWVFLFTNVSTTKIQKWWTYIILTEQNRTEHNFIKQMSPGVRKPTISWDAKTKTQISFAVTAKLISAFVFATWIVQYLFFLNTKFQASSHLQWLYSLSLCLTWSETKLLVFSRRGSNNLSPFAGGVWKKQNTS